MRKLTTIILAGGSLILAIVIGAVETGPGSGGSGENHLMRFESEQIDTITLKRGGEEVVMQQVGTVWQFVTPEPDLINRNSMEALLDQLNHLTILDQLEPKELVGDMEIANLGLDGDEALEIHIKLKGDAKNSVQSIAVGAPSGRVNSVYARRLDRKKADVAVVNGNPHEYLGSPYETLRERQLINLPQRGIVQLAVTTSDRQTVLQRGGTSPDWQMLKPFRVKADQDKVEDLVSALLTLQIAEVDDESTGPMTIPNPVPEGEALIQFWVVGSQNPVKLYIQKLPDSDIWACRTSSRPGRYLLKSDLIESLPTTIAGLRDRRLGKVPEKAVASIVILEVTDKGPESSVILNSNRNNRGANWQVIQENQKAVKANYGMIQKLLERMNEPVIVDFVEGGKLSEYGLEPGSFGVGFNFVLPGAEQPDGSVGEEQSFAKTLQLSWKQDGDKKRLFGNYVGDPNIYELDPKFAEVLPDHPLKWRSLYVTTLNPIHVQEIHQIVTGREPTTLVRDGVSRRWIKPSNIDPISVERLSSRLCNLKAKGWLIRSGDASQALQKPFATFSIKVRQLDRATNEATSNTTTIKFAASPVTGLVYGQIEGSPDVFYIEDSVFRSLIRPVTSSVSRDVPE